MWGLVQLSRPRCEAVPLRSFYDPGLDLQLTSRRALRAPRRPGLKALEISVRGADNMSECHPIHGVVRQTRISKVSNRHSAPTRRDLPAAAFEREFRINAAAFGDSIANLSPPTR